MVKLTESARYLVCPYTPDMWMTPGLVAPHETLVGADLTYYKCGTPFAHSNFQREHLGSFTFLRGIQTRTTVLIVPTVILLRAETKPSARRSPRMLLDDIAVAAANDCGTVSPESAKALL